MVVETMERLDGCGWPGLTTGAGDPRHDNQLSYPYILVSIGPVSWKWVKKGFVAMVEARLALHMTLESPTQLGGHWAP